MFLVWAIMKKAAVNGLVQLVQAFRWPHKFISVGCKPSSGIAGAHAGSFTWLETAWRLPDYGPLKRGGAGGMWVLGSPPGVSLIDRSQGRWPVAPACRGHVGLESSSSPPPSLHAMWEQETSAAPSDFSHGSQPWPPIGITWGL